MSDDQDTCCVQRSICSNTVCDADHVLKSDYQSRRCQGAACSQSSAADQEFCCNPRPTCNNDACNSATHILKSNVGEEGGPTEEEWKCAGATCNTSDQNTCCVQRSICSSTVCDADHVLKSDYQSRRCEGATCSAGLSAGADGTASWTKRVQKHCANDDYGSYSTLGAAGEACLADPNCYGVYDSGCNGTGSYSLCPSRNLSTSWFGSCVYVNPMVDNATCCDDRAACSTLTACAAGYTADTSANADLCAGAVCDNTGADNELCCDENSCAQVGNLGTGVVGGDTDACTTTTVLTTSSDRTCNVKCDTNTYVAQTATVECSATAAAGANVSGKPTCIPRQTCDDEACNSATHTLKGDFALRLCSGGTCDHSDQSECCDPKATCGLGPKRSSDVGETVTWVLSKTTGQSCDEVCSGEGAGICKDGLWGVNTLSEFGDILETIGADHPTVIATGWANDDNSSVSIRQGHNLHGSPYLHITSPNLGFVPDTGVETLCSSGSDATNTYRLCKCIGGVLESGVSDDDCGPGYIYNSQSSESRCVGATCDMNVNADKEACCVAQCSSLKNSTDSNDPNENPTTTANRKCGTGYNYNTANDTTECIGRGGGDTSIECDVGEAGSTDQSSCCVAQCSSLKNPTDPNDPNENPTTTANRKCEGSLMLDRTDSTRPAFQWVGGTVDVGAGKYIYDTTNDNADNACEGSGPGDTSIECDVGGEVGDQDQSRCCVARATCGDADGSGSGTATVTSANCGDGFVYDSTEKSGSHCAGAMCFDGINDAADKATCCVAQATCGPEAVTCGEGYLPKQEGINICATPPPSWPAAAPPGCWMNGDPSPSVTTQGECERGGGDWFNPPAEDCEGRLNGLTGRSIEYQRTVCESGSIEGGNIECEFKPAIKDDERCEGATCNASSIGSHDHNICCYPMYCAPSNINNSEDKVNPNFCRGKTGDTCSFTCLPGYIKSFTPESGGEHTCKWRIEDDDTASLVWEGGMCEECPGGMSGGMSGDDLQCRTCELGKSTWNGTICTDCPAGKYSKQLCKAVDGATEAQLPASCMGTMVCSDPQSITQEECEGGFGVWTADCSVAFDGGGECPDGCKYLPALVEECNPDGQLPPPYTDESEGWARTNRGGRTDIFWRKGKMNAFTSQCEECPVGKYTDEVGARACKDCLPGKYVNTTGSNHLNDCKGCDLGHFTSTSGNRYQYKCPPGTYQNELGQDNCKVCPTGKYSRVWGAVDADSCEECNLYGNITVSKLPDCSEDFPDNLDPDSKNWYPCFREEGGDPDNLQIDSNDNNNNKIGNCKYERGDIIVKINNNNECSRVDELASSDIQNIEWDEGDEIWIGKTTPPEHPIYNSCKSCESDFINFGATTCPTTADGNCGGRLQSHGYCLDPYVPLNEYSHGDIWPIKKLLNRENCREMWVGADNLRKNKALEWCDVQSTRYYPSEVIRLDECNGDVPWRRTGVTYNDVDLPKEDEILDHLKSMGINPINIVNKSDYLKNPENTTCSCMVGYKVSDDGSDDGCTRCPKGKTTININQSSCDYCEKDYYVYNGECLKCEDGGNPNNSPIYGPNTSCSYYNLCKEEYCDDFPDKVPRFPLGSYEKYPETECCVNKVQCDESICPTFTIFDEDKSDVYCSTNPCKPEECCMSLETCSYEDCTTPGYSIKSIDEEIITEGCKVDGVSVECSEELCCDTNQKCSDTNICDKEGWTLKKDAYRYKCRSEECDFDTDKDRCCSIIRGYSLCSQDEDDTECINGVKCSDGRVSREINGSSFCVINSDEHWKCDNEEDPIFCDIGMAVCRIGFIKDNTGNCIIDKNNNFVCSSPNGTVNLTDKRCIGGYPKCKVGTVYNRAIQSCVGSQTLKRQMINKRKELRKLSKKGELNKKARAAGIEKSLLDSGLTKDDIIDLILSRITLDCGYGYSYDDTIGCILDEYDENGQPTHFIKDENNNLRCKLGYIFNDDDENPKCVLNKAAGWKCAIEARTEMESLKQKSIEELIGIAETTIADSDISILNKIKEKPNKDLLIYFIMGKKYCNGDGDPCDEGCCMDNCCNVANCDDVPICGNGRLFNGGNCVDQGEEEDCYGEWSPCLSDCRDSYFTIKTPKKGFGNDCLDTSGNVLNDGDSRSCKGLGFCTEYKDRYCGSDNNNIIVDDLENWNWEWVNEGIRDRCDRIYKGELLDCVKSVVGDDKTRRKCPIYTGKCIGNTNPIEDIDCSLGGNNLVLKEDAYSIDRSGNSYETCCIERNVDQLIKEGRIDSRLIESEEVQSAIDMDQTYEREEIFTRLR